MTCCPTREVAATGLRPVLSRLGTRADQSETVAIPGGTALLGTDSPIIKADGEGPLRRKRLKPFRMDAAAVTSARFKAFADDTGYITDAERLGDSLVFVYLLPNDQPPSQAVATAPWWRRIDGASWRLPYGPVDGRGPDLDDPVTHVSWNDAAAFAQWAGGSLPTETEWEHAARGGLGDVRYPWGDANPDDQHYFPCNIWQGRFPDINTERDGYLGLAPAKSFSPNGYGLYNMAGNVWEWTADPFRVRSLSKKVAAIHARKEGFRLSKGGSFLCHESYCFRYRIAARTGTSPDTSTSHQGFRLVYRGAVSRTLLETG